MFSDAGCGIFPLKLLELIFGDDSGKYRNPFAIDGEHTAVAVTGKIFDEFPCLTLCANAAGQFTAGNPIPTVITGLLALCAVFDALFTIPLPFDLFDPAAAVKILFPVIFGIDNFIRLSQSGSCLSAVQIQNRCGIVDVDKFKFIGRQIHSQFTLVKATPLNISVTGFAGGLARLTFSADRYGSGSVSSKVGNTALRCLTFVM